MEVLIKSKDGHRKVKLNRKKAIHEKCLNCASWHPEKVANCIFNKCPLHPFRTGRGKQDAKLRTRAIREYCLWCINGQVGEISKCPSSDCPLYVFRLGHQKGIKKECFLKRRISSHQLFQEQRL